MAHPQHLGMPTRAELALRQDAGLLETHDGASRGETANVAEVVPARRARYWHVQVHGDVAMMTTTATAVTLEREREADEGSPSWLSFLATGESGLDQLDLPLVIASHRGVPWYMRSFFLMPCKCSF